jgi:hypothetical protein
MAPGDSVLDFGKFKGQRLADMSDEYLLWLTGRYVLVQNRRVVVGKRDSDALRWVQAHKPQYVEEAQQMLAKRCLHCKGALVAIGDARANGKCHPDWKGRLFHKKCLRSFTLESALRRIQN